MLLNLGSVSVLLAFLSPLLVQQQPPQPPGAPPILAPEKPPATPPPTPTGPLRVEVYGVQDMRVAYFGPLPERALEPRARVEFKLTGERIGKVDRASKLILEELVDDTGKNLLDPSAFTDRDRTGTNPISAAANVAQTGFVKLDYTCNSPSTRAAKKITKAKGYVNVVFGGPTEEITIDNPMQHAGKAIENARLKELGLTVRILKPGEESAEPADNRGIPIRIEAGEDMVKNIDLYDESMKRMNVRPRVSKTQKDEPYFYYQIVGGVVTPDTQLVLTVHKKIEREKITFDLPEIVLP